nr:ATP-dependent DNA helicase DDX11 isoform X2 [Plodia interpunctella]
MDPIFSFPFPPYPIQEKFMKELYSTIEESKLGIFESPTGTGKSLSICCGALQWLKDNNQRIISNLEQDISKLKLEISSNSSSDDWLQEEYEKIKKNQVLVELQNKLDKIKKRNEKLNEMKIRVNKLKLNVNNKTVEHYFHKTDKNKKDGDKNNKQENAYDADDDLLLEEFLEKEETENESDYEDIIEKEDDCQNCKIFIGSRTHSQLSQFVGEVKRTIFKDTRVVTLASRQHYCINSNVSKLKNVHLINERCLDLQKSKTKSTAVDEDGKVLKKTKVKSCSGCPYYNQGNIARLKERMLVDIMDMEDIVKCGKELKACPYYASRAAMDEAEVVLMSHAGVASSGARTGISLNLKNNILVLDEAHGLPAALENANSAPLSEKHLSCLKTCLKFYVNKYSSRLSSKNLLTLNQMGFVIGKLLGFIKSSNSSNKVQEDKTIYMLEDFVVKADIDHMNFRPLIDFCRKTRLAPKLHSFSMRYNQEVLESEIQKEENKKNSFQMFMENIKKKKIGDNQPVVKEETKESKEKPAFLKGKQENQTPDEVHSEVSVGTGLYQVMEFLELLCDRSENGRVLVQTAEQNSGSLKYLLLNPTEHFSDVIKQCRSVILAGGTMEPVSEFLQLLTGSAAARDVVNVVKCEHVVPRDNVLALCVSKGPSQLALNFSYENRMAKNMLEEVGRILRNICSVVPGGVVCFLPSYTYEEAVYQAMKSSGVLDTIGKKKRIFREPKSATDVDQPRFAGAKQIRVRREQCGRAAAQRRGRETQRGAQLLRRPRPLCDGSRHAVSQHQVPGTEGEDEVFGTQCGPRRWTRLL